MPHQSAHEARGLVILALSKLEDQAGLRDVHPGVAGHLRGAHTHLVAACTLLAFNGTDAGA